MVQQFYFFVCMSPVNYQSVKALVDAFYKVAVDMFSAYCKPGQTSLTCLDHILTLRPPLLG